MNNTAVVAGIEKQGWKHITLMCDHCGDVYNGGDGCRHAGPYRWNGYYGYDRTVIRADATILGWTTDKETDTDLCPCCSPGGMTKCGEMLIRPNHKELKFKHDVNLQTNASYIIALEAPPIGETTQPFTINIEGGWPDREPTQQPPCSIDLFISQGERVREIIFGREVEWLANHKWNRNVAPYSISHVRIYSFGGGGRIYGIAGLKIPPNHP